MSILFQSLNTRATTNINVLNKLQNSISHETIKRDLSTNNQIDFIVILPNLLCSLRDGRKD